MDAFLFPWICAALPWGYCTPSSPPSPCLLRPSTASLGQEEREREKYLGVVIVSPLPRVEMAFREDGSERCRSGGQIPFRVVLIPCKNVAKLKGKRRCKEIYYLLIDEYGLQGSTGGIMKRVCF